MTEVCCRDVECFVGVNKVGRIRIDWSAGTVGVGCTNMECLVGASTVGLVGRGQAAQTLTICMESMHVVNVRATCEGKVNYTKDTCHDLG